MQLLVRCRLNCHLGLIRSVRPIQARSQSHLYFAIRVRTIIIKKCQNLKLLKLMAQAGPACRAVQSPAAWSLMSVLAGSQSRLGQLVRSECDFKSRA